jgi:hypothetical protein
VEATIFGAISILFFLFQEQESSSSGWMAWKTGRSSKVNWLARSSDETSKLKKPPVLNRQTKTICNRIGKIILGINL